MESITPNIIHDSPEHTLWVAVIAYAIKSAVRKICEPDWGIAWRVNEYRQRVETQGGARRFFINGSCTDILKAIGVNPDWFYRKLKSVHPEIFTPVTEGEHEPSPDR